MQSSELDVNRKSWEAASKQHNLYKNKENMARVIDSGPGYIYDEILELFPELSNKRVVHLFCNDGRELLSILKKGGMGIGLDFSVNAIKVARSINQELNYKCVFVCQEVMSWLQEIDIEIADMFFTSLGSLWWVPDLSRYFELVFKATSTEGKYIVWDFHPFIHVLDDLLNIRYDYPITRIKRIHEEGIVDYISSLDHYHFEGSTNIRTEKFRNPYPVHDYLWGMGEIVQYACEAGWNIERIIEYPYLLGEKYLNGLVKKDDPRYVTSSDKPILPLMFVLVLKKTKTSS